MDFSTFLSKQKPLCLGLPFHKELVSRNIYYSLSERSEGDFSGRNMFEQQCPNAYVCTSECRGRPVPKYSELSGIIQKYNPTEGDWNGTPVWLLKVETCTSCPFKVSCTKLCPSMGAFDARTSNREDLHLDFTSPMEDITDEWLENLYYSEEEEWSNRIPITNEDIAWDCLSEPQKAAVIMVLVQGKTLEQAAEIRGVHVNAVSKSYDSGMRKLKEYGLARKALYTDSSCKFSVDYYRKGLSMVEIADTYEVDKATVSRKIRDFKEKHDIKC